MSIFDKFNETIDGAEREKLETQLKNAVNNSNVNYVEIPSGMYEVELEKMEVRPTSWGDHQVSIQFNIMTGEYKGKKLFYSGGFYEHFEKGYTPTARLISALTSEEVPDYIILNKLMGDKDELNEYLLDLLEVISSAFTFDLNYEVKESNKLNPKTNKPYVNKFYSISDVYDI